MDNTAKLPTASASPSRSVFLHMFSGPADRADGLKHYLRVSGADCVDYDVVNGSECDLLDEHVFSTLLKDVQAGKYDGGVLGPPCNSFSNARKADGEGPGPLRAPTGPYRYGLPKLSPVDKDKVKVGTLLALRALAIFRAFLEQGKPIVLEQPFWRKDDPSAVSMFNLDEFQELLSHQDIQSADFDQCMFGAEHAKRTTVIFAHIDMAGVKLDCTHEKVWWIRPSDGRKYYGAHAPLKGKEPWIRDDGSEVLEADNTMGAYLTAAAAAYPANLNRFLAGQLMRASASAHRRAHEMCMEQPDPPAVQEQQVSTKAGFEFRHSLKGKRIGDADDHLGGMRRPIKALRTIPGYQFAGGTLHKRVLDYLMVNRRVVDQCCEALGSEVEGAGPQQDAIEEVKVLMRQTFPYISRSETTALDSKLDAGLLYRWAKAVNDPDAEHIHQWLTLGAPAGIEVQVQDDGIFPPTTDPEPSVDYHDGWSDDYAGNYTSVDGDMAAEAEVLRLLESNFVKCFDSQAECEAWAGGKICLSKLGLITKHHPVTGRIKRRLILDCKQSQVNMRAWKGGRLLLPRVTDVLDDTLGLLRQVEKTSAKVEWLVLDYSDWFFQVPLHPKERRHFAFSYKGKFAVYLVQAQGSINAQLCVDVSLH